MTKKFELDTKILKYGLEIIQEISDFRPYSSISFQSSEEIVNAIHETSQLVKWDMAKDKPKMQKTVLKIFDSIADSSPGEPINLNLTRYERKSVKAVVKLVKRVLKKGKDGLVMK